MVHFMLCGSAGKLHGHTGNRAAVSHIKKYQVFSSAAEMFLEKLRENFGD